MWQPVTITSAICTSGSINLVAINSYEKSFCEWICSRVRKLLVIIIIVVAAIIVVMATITIAVCDLYLTWLCWLVVLYIDMEWMRIMIGIWTVNTESEIRDCLLLTRLVAKSFCYVEDSWCSDIKFLVATNTLYGCYYKLIFTRNLNIISILKIFHWIFTMLEHKTYTMIECKMYTMLECKT